MDIASWAPSTSQSMPIDDWGSGGGADPWITDVLSNVDALLGDDDDAKSFGGSWDSPGLPPGLGMNTKGNSYGLFQ